MVGTVAIWLAVWFVVSVAFGMPLGTLIREGAAERIPVRDTQPVAPSLRERRRVA